MDLSNIELREEEMMQHHSEHQHYHSVESKKAIINRLSRAIGHLESVKRMVDSDRDCSEVLIQLAAVRSAISNTSKVILKEHIEHCIIHAVKDENMQMIEELEQAIEQFIK